MSGPFSRHLHLRGGPQHEQRQGSYERVTVDPGSFPCLPLRTFPQVRVVRRAISSFPQPHPITHDNCMRGIHSTNRPHRLPGLVLPGDVAFSQPLFRQMTRYLEWNLAHTNYTRRRIQTAVCCIDRRENHAQRNDRSLAQSHKTRVMPSSPPLYQHGASSPAHGGHDGYRRSQFTYRHLSQLASFGTANPLRVVAHVDLDAFYAQCEMVRLGLPKETPLAVQQWYVGIY